MAVNARKMPKSATLRRTPQQERGKESQSKILNGARKILSQGGFEKFSMRRISSASGVGLSTIYDYFPSKTSVLHTLLEERLMLRLKIFDRTIAAIPASAKLSEFIESYLGQMRKEGFWSIYDIGLRTAATHEPSLKSLLEWYEAETIDRYVRALRSAGSKWSEDDLRTTASYLLSISAQFEPGVVVQEGRKSRKLTLELVHHTFSTVLRKVLN
tara:strand:- start:3141 stop:3782 length:642 start_codon:yes stop_codon:yes gene_type:complete